MLMILSVMAWQNRINQARDAQRKSDLEKISIAFENYYNDNGCFPDEDILQICRGDSLNPYLSSIPCDPTHDLPYCYIHDPDDTCGQTYKVLAPLKSTTDPIIEKLFCHGDLYCGYEPNCEALISPPAISDYSCLNYGVTSTNIQLYNPDASPMPDPSSSPLPSPSGDIYACDNTGLCNSYGDPEGAGCPIWWEDIACEGGCTNPANWCDI